jgi:hypothetical protein
MRGTVSKAVYEGGEQERMFAAQYRDWAEKSMRWPRVHRLLLSMSEEWENDAKREDDRAEQNKIRFS